jgi:hypothetical protein
VSGLEAEDTRKLREPLAAAVSGIPVVGDGHQDLGPFSHEEELDLAGHGGIARLIHRIYDDGVPITAVLGAAGSPVEVYPLLDWTTRIILELGR